MYDCFKLSPENLEICQKTISSNAFFMMVGDALVSKQNLSVVRMADGENNLLNECLNAHSSDMVVGFNDPSWAKRYGIMDMTAGELKNRIIAAGNECSHFAPSISGVQMNEYKMYHFFPKRDFYIDNFFVNAWTEELIVKLFQTAGHVLMINNNAYTADAMQNRAKWGLGVRVTWLKMTNWKESESVIEKASKINAPLTLFSAGPASKYIGPRIANGGPIPKVALDIGNAMDRFCLSSYDKKPRNWNSENADIRKIFEKNLANAKF